jgi:hypothetical protein
MLLSLLREVPPSGGKTAAGAGSPSEPVKTLPAGEVPVPAGPAKAQTIKNSVPDIAQAIKNSVPEIAQAIKNSVPDVGQPITQDVKTGALDLAAFSDAPGNTMPSPAPSHILPVAPDTGVAPAVAALLTPEIAPAVLPRVSIPRVGVEGVSPRSASKEPRLLETVSPVEESPAPGILTGTVRNVIGIVPRTGDKQNSQDTADDGTLPAPALGETASPGSPAPALADVQAQPSRKPSAETPGESPSTAPVDAAGTVRAPSDLSAFRTSQAALGSQMTPGKQDPVTSAAPLREIPSPYAPLPAEVSHRIADQVVQNLKLQVDGSTSEIKMTLKPPSLGEVQLSIHVEDSKMAAQIDVSQAVVKAALEAHMPQLRLALQEHGIEVQRIDVMLPEQSLQREGSGTGGERTGRRGTRRSLSGDDPESLQGAKDMGYNTIELIM